MNVVSGWFKGEFTALGEPWLEHDERYRRSEEFIRALRGIWTQPSYELAGDFYRFRGYDLKPRPIQTPHPEIFQGGNSTAARRMAGRVSDWYFMNGNTAEGISEQIREVRGHADAAGRTLKFGVNAFIVARDTEAEARSVVAEIIEKADREAVDAFGHAVKQAGRSTGDKKGMWAESSFEDLVQYNDGFRTGLVGSHQQVAEKIVALKSLGVDLVLGGFLHYLEDVESFGKNVLPRVRDLEAKRAKTARPTPGVAEAGDR